MTKLTFAHLPDMEEVVEHSIPEELKQALIFLEDKLSWATDEGPIDDGWRSIELVRAWDVVGKYIP